MIYFRGNSIDFTNTNYFSKFCFKSKLANNKLSTSNESGLKTETTHVSRFDDTSFLDYFFLDLV